MKRGIFAVIILFLLSVSVLAKCPEPDIKVYDACCSKCPDAVEHTFAYSECINKCLGMWSDMQDQYYACGKAEREAAEKAQLERDNKIRGIEEEKVPTISVLEGAIWFSRPDALARTLASDEILSIQPGDSLRSEEGALLTLNIKDGGIIEMGPETELEYEERKITQKDETNLDVLMRYTVSHGLSYFYNDPNKGKMQIKTPFATVTDKQTKFIVKVDADKASFYLYEGMLEIETISGQNLTIIDNQVATVDSTGNASVSPLVIEDWDGYKNNIETGVAYVTAAEKAAQAEKQAEQRRGEEAASGFFSQMDNRVVYLIVVMAFVLIVLVAVIVKRRKKN